MQHDPATEEMQRLKALMACWSGEGQWQKERAAVALEELNGMS